MESYLNRINTGFAIAITDPIIKNLYSKIEDRQYFLNEISKIPKYRSNPEVALNIDANMIVGEIVSDLLTQAKSMTPFFNPWTIELAKDRIGLTSLLGPVRTKLPVLVSVIQNGKIDYTYDLTEDFTFGIVMNTSSLNNGYIVNGKTTYFMYYLQDIYGLYGSSRIYPTLFLEKYSIDWKEKRKSKLKKYTAVSAIQAKRITFNTIDLLTGVKTASKWTNVPITSLIYDTEENGIRLSIT